MPLSWPPPEPPSELGPRRAALLERRRRRWAQILIFGGGGALLIIAIMIETLSGGSDVRPGTTPTFALGGHEEDPVTTTLLVGTRETAERASSAVWLALLSVDGRSHKGAVVYVPAHTAVEVPGRGLMAIGDALASGGMPLLLVSAENLLGIEIDRYADLSDRDARFLFAETGPISVDVPSEVRVPAGKNQARLIFTPGPQRLSAEFLVQLLYTIGIDGDDEELGTRHLAFWDAFMDTFAEDPAALGTAIEQAGPALAESDARPIDHASFFEVLAELAPDDITITTLPVTQISVGGSELYQVDRDEVSDFVVATLGPASSPVDQVEVQILNGNGVPGIGQEAAQRLINHGFRVILSGNAPRLNYANTLIVTYDSSPEGQAIADKAKELLGVGQVQVSAQEQGIVDLTIVIGRDFLGAS